MPECPPFWHIEQRKHDKLLLHENFGKFQLKLTPRHDLFLLFLLFT